MTVDIRKIQRQVTLTEDTILSLVENIDGGDSEIVLFECEDGVCFYSPEYPEEGYIVLQPSETPEEARGGEQATTESLGPQALNGDLIAERAVRLLNEAIALDAGAVGKLLSQRVPCNEALAQHSTIQVSSETGEDRQVGVLGLLNGLCGTRDDTTGRIAVWIEGEVPFRAELRRREVEAEADQS